MYLLTFLSTHLFIDLSIYLDACFFFGADESIGVAGALSSLVDYKQNLPLRGSRTARGRQERRSDSLHVRWGGQSESLLLALITKSTSWPSHQYLFIYLSTYLVMCLSSFLVVHVFSYLFISCFIDQVYQCIDLFFDLFIQLSTYLLIYLFIYQFVFVSSYLCIHRFIYLSTYLIMYSFVITLFISLCV